MKQVAGCVPVFEGKIVLVSSRKHPGQFVLPKGTVEPGESVEAAALRECYELKELIGSFEEEGKAAAVRHTYFLMKVTVLHNQWPEETERKRLLLSFEETETLLLQQKRTFYRDIVGFLKDIDLHQI